MWGVEVRRFWRLGVIVKFLGGVWYMVLGGGGLVGGRWGWDLGFFC